MRKPKVEFEDLFEYISCILFIEKLEILFQYTSYSRKIITQFSFFFALL